MNSKQARRIRTIVYGDQTARQRSYTQEPSTKKIYPDGTEALVPGIRYADPKRALYQLLKKQFYLGLSLKQLNGIVGEML